MLTTKLSAMLQTMGIVVTTNTLESATVSNVHYSKNILLTDGSITYSYIKKIKEANVKLSCDVNQTDYRNEGHCYKWHYNSYEVVFYDKIKDLEMSRMSDKRAVEKNTALHIDLFDIAKRAKTKT